MNAAICNAIKQRNVITFSYDGEIRIVEPHCHGFSTANNEVLRGYQTGGASKSGNPVDWKLFEVAKMVNIQPHGERFINNRPGYNPNDRNMISVHCYV